MLRFVLLIVTLEAASASASASSCKTFPNTDFNGHDLHKTYAANPDECCSSCANTTGCAFWTFMPAETCYLKTSDAGRRPSPKSPAYTSGCKDMTCATLPPTPKPVPTPAPPTPSPTPVTPVVRGGGNCTDDFDCSLAGDCKKGKCVCDGQFTGEHCGVLRLRRAKVNNGLNYNATSAHTWGGHAMKDPSSGKWVGFFSYMAGRCDLGTWMTNSMILSAVADAPDGPYDQQLKPVTPPWTHNAMISQHPNGSYFLFHIGPHSSWVPSKEVKNCSESHPGDPYYPFPEGIPEPAPATTHVSGVNNPAPFFFENGTSLIYGRTDVRWAASIDGPWDSANHRTTVPDDGGMRPEDPFVWRDSKGRFHMLFNANSGHSNCKGGVPCGGHAWSRDALAWSKPKIPAFGTIIHYEDNSTRTFDFVERPQIAQQPDGTPLTFFAGHGYGDISTLAIMFCQEKRL